MDAAKIWNSVGRLGASAASLLKVAAGGFDSHRAEPPREGALVVLGNGPSLLKTIEERADLLEANPTLAVNFAANAPEFAQLRPDYYVLADGHFFLGKETDPNVARLWDNLAAVSWPMKLFVPTKFRRAVPEALLQNPAVTLDTFSLTPVEGTRALCHALFRRGCGMPRPRNVLIPSLMLALREGFREIYVAGADHSWLETLRVDDLNRVVSVQPHFYADDDKEHARVAREYAGYHLHDILGSMTIAFRSYWEIRAYAEALGAKIVNITPGSYIDAFPRS